MPTEEQFTKSHIERDPSGWTTDPLYRGYAWDDYIMEGGYDTLWSGDFEQQILEAVLYARSWSRPPTDHLFVFPVRLDPPAGLPGATVLNMHQQFIDGGTWELGSKVRVFFAGTDGRRAYRDYNVKRFRLSMLSADDSIMGELAERLTTLVDATTPEAIEDIFEYLQSTTVNKLGVMQPGNTTIYTPGAARTADGGPYMDAGAEDTGKKLWPFLLAAGLAAKFLIF
jgi:hypothetical protein